MTSPFLATTSLEEFWDPSRPMVFLGPWCLRYSRRSVWGRLGAEVRPGIWQSAQFFLRARSSAEEVYEQLVQELGERLDALHGEKRSERYWRIMLGPWLFHYIHTLYDRYMTVKDVLDAFPGLTTIGLAEESHRTPRDSLDFVQLASHDAYNLQLFTRVLAFMGVRFPTSRLEPAAFEEAYAGWQVSSAGTDRLRARMFLCRLERILQGKRPVFFKSSYFPRSLQVRLMLGARGRVMLDHGPALSVPAPGLDRDARQRLSAGLTLPQGEFGQLVASLLSMDVPVVFVEGLQILRKVARRWYPDHPAVIASAVSWYWDEAFKEWAASLAERRTRLAGVQHGGNYGSARYNVAESHERKITDVFYTWGWDTSDDEGRVRPMPATKLAARRALRAEGRGEDVLLVTSAEPRYLVRFGNLRGADLTDYIAWQLRFAAALPDAMRRHLRVRLYQRDFGWDFALRWQERFPEVRLENWSIPLERSMEDCRLYVCDHLSTTFIEALSSGKPTILFWDPGTPELGPDAKPFYDRLQEHEVLHHDPESAARTVSRVHADPGSWWREPERRDAVASFCHRFARTSPHALDIWAEELTRLAREDAS